MRPRPGKVEVAALGGCGLVLLAGFLGLLPIDRSQALEQGWADCLACHPDHDSGLPALSPLRPEVSGPIQISQCLSCHARADLAAGPTGQSHPLRPVGEHIACTSCHQPVQHSAEVRPPLPQGEYDVQGCYQCHPEIEARMTLSHSHDSNRIVSCVRCHPPHGVYRAALPQSLWPPELAAGWYASTAEQASNRACLECHAEAGLMGRRDAGFVALNTVNYHERHVQAGRCLCIECHDPHGSVRPAMLRTELLSGEALSFHQRHNGGNCTVSCHGVDHQAWGYANAAY